MSSRDAKELVSCLLKGSAILFIVLIVAVDCAMAEERGALRGVVLSRQSGERLAGAIVEIFSQKDDQVRYSGKTNAEGAFYANALPAGSYLVEIKAFGVKVRYIDWVIVIANNETDLGYIRLGPQDVDCNQPGVHCLMDMSYAVRLACIEDTTILRDFANRPVTIENEELRRRAIKLVAPNWPKGAIPGYTTSVYVGIGTDGRVMCTNAGDDTSTIDQALRDAALQWRFQPILEKGEPISAIGLLEFEVP